MPVLAISAATGEGDRRLRRALARAAAGRGRARCAARAGGHRRPPVRGRRTTFDVDHDADGAFRVRGTRIERMAAQTNFDNEESAERFQRDLARLGIDARAAACRLRPGDTVRIGSIELEWEPELWEAR